MGKAKNALSQLIKFGRQAEGIVMRPLSSKLCRNLPTNLPVFVTPITIQQPFHPKTPHYNPHVKQIYL